MSATLITRCRASLDDFEVAGSTLIGRAFNTEHLYEGVRDYVRSGEQILPTEPYNEMYGRSCLAKFMQERGAEPVPVDDLHKSVTRGEPDIGRARFEVVPDGVNFVAVIHDEVALNRYRAGADVSIDFIPYKSVSRRDADGTPYTLWTEIAIRSIALAPPNTGQLAGAKVLAMRSGLDASALTEPRRATLEDWRARSEALFARTDKLFAEMDEREARDRDRMLVRTRKLPPAKYEARWGAYDWREAFRNDLANRS